MTTSTTRTLLRKLRAIALRAKLTRSDGVCPEAYIPPPFIRRHFLFPKTTKKRKGRKEIPVTVTLKMAFFTSAVSTLETLVVALGAGLAVWGVINLLEGYGSDNAGAKSQGMKQLMAGGGVILLGLTLVPMLATLF